MAPYDRSKRKSHDLLPRLESPRHVKAHMIISIEIDEEILLDNMIMSDIITILAGNGPTMT